MNILVYMWLYLTALQDDHIPTSVLSVNGSEQTEGGTPLSTWHLRAFPLSSRLRRDTFPARGDSFWLVVIQKAPRATGRLCKPLSFNYSMMLWTTPEATVRPPSRIAKRRPSSMAIGVIRVISISMLSPGITISTPSGSLMVPVTSVVLK